MSHSPTSVCFPERLGVIAFSVGATREARGHVRWYRWRASEVRLRTHSSSSPPEPLRCQVKPGKYEAYDSDTFSGSKPNWKTLQVQKWLKFQKENKTNRKLNPKQKYMSYHSGLSTPCVRIRYLIIQEPIVGCYHGIVGRYRPPVGRYRTKLSKLESTRSGLYKTSKISRIDPVFTKLRWFKVTLI